MLRLYFSLIWESKREERGSETNQTHPEYPCQMQNKIRHVLSISKFEQAGRVDNADPFQIVMVLSADISKKHQLRLHVNYLERHTRDHTCEIKTHFLSFWK